MASSSRPRRSVAPGQPLHPTFAVDDVVYATYGLGLEKFTARVKKVNSDGTFDIVFDDAPKEVQKDTEGIDMILVDFDTLPCFTAGEAVEVRQNGGLQFVPAVVTAVSTCLKKVVVKFTGCKKAVEVSKHLVRQMASSSTNPRLTASFPAEGRAAPQQSISTEGRTSPQQANPSMERPSDSPLAPLHTGNREFMFVQPQPPVNLSASRPSVRITINCSTSNCSDTCSIQCFECSQPACNRCSFDCINCCEAFCKRCIARCGGCKRRACYSHIVQCSSCNVLLCRSDCKHSCSVHHAINPALAFVGVSNDNADHRTTAAVSPSAVMSTLNTAGVISPESVQPAALVSTLNTSGVNSPESVQPAALVSTLNTSGAFTPDSVQPGVQSENTNSMRASPIIIDHDHTSDVSFARSVASTSIRVTISEAIEAEASNELQSPNKDGVPTCDTPTLANPPSVPTCPAVMEIESPSPMLPSGENEVPAANANKRKASSPAKAEAASRKKARKQEGQHWNPDIIAAERDASFSLCGGYIECNLCYTEKDVSVEGTKRLKKVKVYTKVQAEGANGFGHRPWLVHQRSKGHKESLARKEKLVRMPTIFGKATPSTNNGDAAPLLSVSERQSVRTTCCGLAKGICTQEELRLFIKYGNLDNCEKHIRIEERIVDKTTVTTIHVIASYCDEISCPCNSKRLNCSQCQTALCSCDVADEIEQICDTCGSTSCSCMRRDSQATVCDGFSTLRPRCRADYKNASTACFQARQDASSFPNILVRRIKLLFSGTAPLHLVLQSLKKKILTDVDIKLLTDFTKSVNQYGKKNENRVALADQCKVQIQHNKWFQKNREKLIQYGFTCPDGVNSTPTTDDFLQKFGDFYIKSKGNKPFRDSLLGNTLELVIARSDGHVNARMTEKFLSFCIIVRFVSKVVYKFFSSQFVGASERYIRRVVSGISGDDCIIVCSLTAITSRVQQYISNCKPDPVTVLGPAYIPGTFKNRLISHLSLDGSKAARGYGVYKGNIVGGKGENALLPVTEANLNLPITDACDEIKIAVLTVQAVKCGISPMTVIAGKPQKCNSVDDDYTDTCIAACMSVESCVLVSIAFDACASDTSKLCDILLGFMLGSHQYLALVDPNHIAKSTRNQIILGTQVVTAGGALVDPGLLVDSVAKELWNVSDFASDLLVLKLCSVATLGKLRDLIDCESPTESYSSVYVTGITLFFLRAFLTAVNADEKMTKKDQVCVLWASLIWFTSLRGVHVITKRNFAASAIGCILLAMQEGVTCLRRATSEPAEHTFGYLRRLVNSFTVVDFCILIQRVLITLALMVKHGFTHDSSKGYMSTFKGYMDAISNLVAKNKQAAEQHTPSTGFNGVNVDYDSAASVATQIAPQLFPLLRYVSTHMTALLSTIGFTTEEISPFCDITIDSMEKLAAIVFNYQDSNFQSSSIHHAAFEHSASNVEPASRLHSRVVNEADEADEVEVEDDLDDLLVGLLARLEQTEEQENEMITLASSELMASDVATDPPLSMTSFEAMLTAHTKFNGDELLPVMFESAVACAEFLVMKERERGSVNQHKKTKGLFARWTERLERTDTTSVVMLRKGLIIRAGANYFRITSVYRPGYNKNRLEAEVPLGASGIKVHATKVTVMGTRELHLQDDNACAIEERFVQLLDIEESDIAGFISRIYTHHKY